MTPPFNFSSTFLAQNGIAASTVTAIAVLMNVGNVLVTLLSVWLMDRVRTPAPRRRRPAPLSTILSTSRSTPAPDARS